eukprot:234356-Pleurochrysis_carterae.AAC.4
MKTKLRNATLLQQTFGRLLLPCRLAPIGGMSRSQSQACNMRACTSHCQSAAHAAFDHSGPQRCSGQASDVRILLTASAFDIDLL